MGKIWFTEHEEISREFQNLSITDLINAAITIKPNEYDQSYGIDWCEMSEDLKKIKSFQTIKVDDISHVIDDLKGQFINCTTTEQKEDKLLKLYNTEEYLGEDIPTPWLNLAIGKIAIIDITIHIEAGLNIDSEDYITFEHDDIFFEITYKKSRTDIQLNKNIKLKGLHRNSNKKTFNAIEIKALKTFSGEAKVILLKTKEKKVIGKIEMAANDLVNLDIKIIPIVFKKANPIDEEKEAKVLYNDIVTTNKLGDYLNNKSLNQLGVKTNIKPLKLADIMVVDNVVPDLHKFYDSTNKYFHDQNINTLNEHFIDRLKDIHLKKPDNKRYKGGIIFVTNENYFDPNEGGNVQAFSKKDPLRYQAIMIFNKGINENDVFAHELAHMLGATHPFLEKDNTEIHEYTKGKNVVDGKKYWKDRISELKKHKEGNLKELEELEAKKDPTNLEKITIAQLKEILEEADDATIYKDNIRKIDLFKETEFKVTKGKTLNFMDYDITRTYFSRLQATIAKQECKDFYQ